MQVVLVTLYLSLCVWLGKEFWNEVKTDVHGRNARHHHRNQLRRVALQHRNTSLTHSSDTLMTIKV